MQLLRANIFGERGAGMFFEDPLEMPFRIAGSPGDGFNVQAAIKVVVDPVEQIVNECTRVHLASPYATH